MAEWLSDAFRGTGVSRATTGGSNLSVSPASGDE